MAVTYAVAYGGSVFLDNANPTTDGIVWCIALPYSSGGTFSVPANAKLPFTLSVAATDSTCVLNDTLPCTAEWSIRPCGGAWSVVGTNNISRDSHLSDTFGYVLQAGSYGLTNVSCPADQRGARPAHAYAAYPLVQACSIPWAPRK